MKENSGPLGELNEEQTKTLEAFKSHVRSLGCLETQYDDLYLIRFLRARKFELKETITMWNNFIKWRKDNNIDDYRNFIYGEIDEVKQCYPHGFFRTDKQGRPIYIERLGLLKLQQLFKCTSEDRLIKYIATNLERLINDILPTCAKLNGKKEEQLLVIIDLKGGATKVMTKQVYDLVKTVSTLIQDNYPEILGKMFIVNAPLLWSGNWAMIKPGVDERTRAKITTLAGQFESQLLDAVDAENLPDFLGGKCPVEEYGESMTNEQGPWMVDTDDKGAADDGDGNNNIGEMNMGNFGEEEKDNGDFTNLKEMLAGMNIGKGIKLPPAKKQEEDNDDDQFKGFAQNFKNMIPDTPHHTQMDDDS
jgi:hypothetical protein